MIKRVQGIFCIILALSLINIFIAPDTVFAASDERLNVPNFRQIWKPWGKELLGFSQDQIENSGCALTSLSMVMKYYGVETDPGDLNNWLKENGGYLGKSSIVWSKAAEKSGGTVQYAGKMDFENAPADLDYIRTELDSGHPVIARMKFLGYHYVVICGYSGSTFYINDPFSDDPSLTINSQYEPYNDPASSIKGIVIFHGTASAPARVPVIKTPSDPVSDFRFGGPVINAKPAQIVLNIGYPYMTVNGIKKEIDPGKGTVPVVYYNETTLVPLRAIVEEMGGIVDWGDSDRKITVKQGLITLEMWINSKTAYLNGVQTEIEVSPKLIKGRTMLPLRFIAENIGCQVDWEGQTKKITITK